MKLCPFPCFTIGHVLELRTEYNALCPLFTRRNKPASIRSYSYPTRKVIADTRTGRCTAMVNNIFPFGFIVTTYTMQTYGVSSTTGSRSKHGAVYLKGNFMCRSSGPAHGESGQAPGQWALHGTVIALGLIFQRMSPALVIPYVY